MKVRNWNSERYYEKHTKSLSESHGIYVTVEDEYWKTPLSTATQLIQWFYWLILNLERSTLITACTFPLWLLVC
jgi:hypothetical protein